MQRRRLAQTAIALVAGAALTACAVTPVRETDRPTAADGTVCPDVHRPLPFPMHRPDCWTDEEWNEHLEYAAERAKNGDQFGDWSYF